MMMLVRGRAAQNQQDNMGLTPQKYLSNNKIMHQEKEKDPTPSRKLLKTKEKLTKIWDTPPQHATKTQNKAKRPEEPPNKNKLRGYKIQKKKFAPLNPTCLEVMLRRTAIVGTHSDIDDILEIELNNNERWDILHLIGFNFSNPRVP